MHKNLKIAVAIPCYKVRSHIAAVIEAIPDFVEKIYVVDDCCPELSGKWILNNFNKNKNRIKILFHEKNKGVGGAVVTAYRQALADGMDIVVKIDGDGQMDPELIPLFISPIRNGLADYTKGNRFFRPESLQSMPKIRLIGNAGLSFLTKLSCGYWSIMDPTNGYTAIHTSILKKLPLEKIENRYFFETDMLFRLNTLRAVVKDVPMDSVYGDEESGLKISKILPEFLNKHMSCLFRRYVYMYLLRDFNIGSLYSIFGMFSFVSGIIFGVVQWIHSFSTGVPATSGTVMLAALPIFVGMQFLIAFLHFDVSHTPMDVLSVSNDADVDFS